MRRDAQLWTGVLAGPTVWFIGFLANFALAPWACTLGWKAALFVIAAISLVLTAASGLLSWKLWRQVGIELPGESGGAVAHERSLALAGVLLSAMFFLVVLAQFVPNVLLGGCD